MPSRSREAKKGGSPARDVLYSEAAKYAPRAIAVLVDIMEHGDNDNARMGAAKAILSKAIPDLKSIEADIRGNEPLVIKIVPDISGDYISQNQAFPTNA